MIPIYPDISFYYKLIKNFIKVNIKRFAFFIFTGYIYNAMRFRKKLKTKYAFESTMLTLLLKTRFQYYRNYIRYNFDRRTKIEIALILLVLALLTLRSPADIGYNFKWMHDENFPLRWANIFVVFIPIFYLVSEAFAIVTLRTSSEWNILGALPFSREAVASYYLLRHLSKTALLILISCLPFLVALKTRLDLRILRFFAASGMVVFLQFIAFEQAYRLRNRYKSFWQRIALWGLPDIFILGFLVITSSWLTNILSTPDKIDLSGLLWLWIVLPLFLKFIQRKFALRDVESKTLITIKLFTSKASTISVRLMRGFYRSFILQDILFLWRQKRATFLIPILSMVIAIIIAITGDDTSTIYVGLLSLEAILSLLFIGTVIMLFEKDVTLFGFLRSLPIPASSFWWARWLFIAGLIGAPMFVSIVIMVIKSGIDLKFILFVMGSTFAIPSIIATLFCNSGFGLFPHTSLNGLITSISIILMFLLWFFMPFGTIILFAVMILWIRKSQRHFQFLECL